MEQHLKKIKHKKKPSNIGPWKQFRDLNIYVNPMGEVKYKCGSKEYLFKKWEFKSRNNASAQMVIMTKNRRYYVKRILWEAFKGPIPDGYAVVHKNGLYRCDELNNLKLEKTADYCKRVSGNYKKRFVIDNTHNRMFRGASQAAKYLGICKSTVIRYCNGKIKEPAYDLHWGSLVSGDDL